MIWGTIDFVCRETALHLRRERLIAIATISTVAVLLVVLGAVVLLLMDLRTWTRRMTDELEIWGFFSEDTSREDALAAAESISSWPSVRSVRFVTKEEGWERQKGVLPSSAEFHDMENPLPDAVQVRARDAEHVSGLADRLRDLQGIEAVNWAGSLARSMVKLKRAVSATGVIVALLVAVAGVFIVHNTIRLALHSRWREIYIMQLVGASRSVVAAPFLLEGMLHGLFGAVLSCCVLLPAHMYLRDISARSAPFFLLVPDRALLPFGLCLGLAGGLLGLTGAAVSVRRYLRRKPGWQG